MTRGGSPFIRIADTRATAWMPEGNCWADDDKLGRLFDPSAEGQRQAAADICAGCPATDACLRHALDQRIDHGVWGGKTEVERRQLRRKLRSQDERAEEIRAAREDRRLKRSDVAALTGLHVTTVFNAEIGQASKDTYDRIEAALERAS